MNRSARMFASVFAFILLLMPGLGAAKEPETSIKKQTKVSRSSPPPQADAMTLWQARRAVVASLTAPGMSSHFSADIGSFRFTLDGFEFDGGQRRGSKERFKIDLKTLEPVAAIYGRMSGISRLKDEEGRDLPAPLNHVELRPDPAGVIVSLATALNRLRAFAGSEGDPLRTSSQQTAAWRALPSKPPIPEEVRKQRLLAENAVKEKQPDIALQHYETGLELYPTWPQGCFNAALIAGELGFYEEAIEHMQSYLELVPDAPDAQAARDQIVIWRDKARQPRS